MNFKVAGCIQRSLGWPAQIPLSSPQNNFKSSHLSLQSTTQMAANTDSVPSPAPAPLSLKKENVTPINSKIAELKESRAELLDRIQNLKNDLQSWRSKLDTQVKSYRDELSDLKKTLNVEVDQLRSEFQELRTTLQQQQEDVTVSLKNLGLQDVSEEAKDTEGENM